MYVTLVLQKRSNGATQIKGKILNKNCLQIVEYYIIASFESKVAKLRNCDIICLLLII